MVLGVVVLVFLFLLRRKALSMFRIVLVVLGIALPVLAWWSLSQGLRMWQQSMRVRSTVFPGFPLDSVSGGSISASHFAAFNPAADLNPDLTALTLLVGVAVGMGYAIYKLTTPTTRMRAWQALWGELRRDRSAVMSGNYELIGMELGIRKDSGRSIRIDGKDRFINTLVVGSIGTGKTSRILTKGAYQDLLAIARGVPLDVIVMDPDGGFVDSVLVLAERLHIPASVIDLRSEAQKRSNVSFNPFAGGDLSDIIDNVRAVLKEQMGHQEGFFQVAQDDLVRTVIQVQAPLWPDTDFVKFAELITDPLHFRAICQMVVRHAVHRTEAPGKKKKGESDDFEAMWRVEEPYVKARYDDMAPYLQSVVLSAARSFLIDTRSEQKLEHLEKVTKGLKMVVSELSTNAKMREVLGQSSLSAFDFRSFFSATAESGRVVAVVTGNRPIGNLFGKLYLVSLKMYALSRPGNENTRRPVYVWIDEFHRFATESLADWFAQGRKYRTAIHVAIQTRAQLELRANQGFIDVVEGSCRNKIYFPAPAPEDARYLQEALGTVAAMKETVSHNRITWFDERRLDPKVSAREQIDPRFRIEHLLFSLRKDEAVFLMTVDNQAQVPTIGYTSYADEWLQGRRLSEVVISRPGAIHGGEQEAIEATVDRVKTDGVKHQPFLASPDADPNERLPMSSQPVSTASESTISEKSQLEQVVAHVIVPDQPAMAIEKYHQSALTELAMSPSSTDSKEEQQTPSAITPEAALTKGQKPRIQKPKVCPSCPSGILHLTDDKRKWRCDTCGFERRNRSTSAAASG